MILPWVVKKLQKKKKCFYHHREMYKLDVQCRELSCQRGWQPLLGFELRQSPTVAGLPFGF